MKKLLKKLIFGHKSSSEAYVSYLKKKGFRIGKDVTIYSPRYVTIDETRPWMIEIGNHVRITKNVTLLTHGYDWSVLKRKYGSICGSCGKIKIGNNVFIGMNSTILKNVEIGNNVIIGANSLVNKNIPDNVVVAGNPAKVISTIEEYYEKRKNAQLDEATECVKEYYQVYKKMPSKEVLREFIWLFEDRNIPNEDNSVFFEIGSLCDNLDFTKKEFISSVGKFNSYEEFIEYCQKKVKNK